MRTPCQADPELWVSDLPESRLQAVDACRTCPALRWCKTEAARTDPSLRTGVWAGVDYSRHSVTEQGVTDCEQCGVTFVRKRTGRPAHYCSSACYNQARYERQQDSRNCEECGAAFFKNGLSLRQWAGRRFCSRKCFGKSKAVA